ncbi:hypothetical protein SAMN05192545_1941 [Maribacter dokdonensis]|uniref:Right handed beta helix region n=1 Tax=Maribacter dokdonensis TaxID=320912 RepID=A0ABY0UIE9_9FLAO|nr:hypothetical protein [Maribacter dokdonensis]SDS72916.1 hypothetical protein SAMN05192545_1941 [Maribacter dokdonensis]
MSKFLRFFSKLTLSFFALFTLFSCSKDADLLSEYVINKNDDQQSLTILTNDSFFMAAGQNTILMDVLNNDNLSANANVTIIETSAPLNGIVTINDDNTLTYRTGETIPEETTPEETTPEETTPEETTSEVDNTPEEQSTTEDTFTYTAEVVDEETGTVTVEEAIVTVTNSENILPTTGDNVFYVTTEGKSSNNGKSEQSAWDIEHGFKTAKAGDIIYIKAGNYGNKNLVVNNSGTSSNPISFIGYTNSPGDLVSNEGSTFTYGDILDSSKMPLIQGIRTNNEGKGEGIVIEQSNIYISNFQIKYYEEGLRSTGNYNIIENIIVSDVGDFNPDHSTENASSAFDNYSGKGITLKGNYVTLRNSVVINAGAEGIHVKNGTNQTHSYNSVYSDNSTNPCDYFYLFSSSSNDNTVDNAYIYREKGLSHKGHGLICKGEASNNKFTSFEIINTVLELSFEEVHDNLFEKGIIKGSYDRNIRYRNTEGGILLANGAHHNILKDIEISEVEAIISFNDWNDGTNSVLDINDAGNNNTLTNIQGENAEIAINFDEFAKLEGSAHNNIIENSSFKDINRIFQVNRPNSNNKFIQCTFENIDTFQQTSNGYDYILNSNTSFSNIIELNLGFSIP